MSQEHNLLQPQDFSRRVATIEGREVVITAYRVGDACYCHVENASPGATIARGQGKTEAEAESEALAKASAKLLSTRVRTVH
jgi:hypothetical protein